MIKIEIVEKRKMIMSKENYQKVYEMIKKDKGYVCKIDGQPYYFSEASAYRMRDEVEVTFVSINSLDFTHSIEIEEDADDVGQ